VQRATDADDEGSDDDEDDDDDDDNNGNDDDEVQEVSQDDEMVQDDEDSVVTEDDFRITDNISDIMNQYLSDAEEGDRRDRSRRRPRTCGVVGAKGPGPVAHLAPRVGQLQPYCTHTVFVATDGNEGKPLV
jgi:hypothetical protein